MGIGYDATLWTLAQVPALSQVFQVVIFDNRDVGRSSMATGAYTIADMADDMAALMDALGLTQAHVLGLSMGGMIAQQFALRHAGRLQRLVLSGCGAAPARVAFDPIRTWNWVKAADRTGEVFACQQFTWLFSHAFRRNREAVQQTISMLTSNPNPVGPEAYNRQSDAYLRYDALDRLAHIRSPTLVLVGEQDLLTPPWVCREVADRIPGARFEIIRGDGSSHVVPIERPQEFNELVTAFLLASEPADVTALRTECAH
jgi:pimeloyl-ACP methyl ester carboxylesterase